MAIKSIETKKQFPIEIDLTGPDGNAFALMGLCKTICNTIKMER